MDIVGAMRNLKISFGNLDIIKITIIITIFCSVLMVFIRPPFQSPDEYDHYKRSVTLSISQFVQPVQDQSGVYIDSEHIDFMNRYGALPFKPNNKVNEIQNGAINYDEVYTPSFSAAPGTAYYAPIIYGLNYVSMNLVRLFTTNLVSIYWAVCIVNVLIFYAVLAWLIREDQLNLVPLLAVITAPLFIFQIGSWSQDSTYFMLSLVFSYLVITKKYLRISIAICTIISLAKINYILMFFPLLFLVKNKRDYVFIGLALSIVMLWTYVAAITTVGLRRGDIGLHSNLDLIASHPISAFKIYLSSLIDLSRVRDMAWMAIGSLGWLDYRVDDNIYVTISFVWLMIAVVSVRVFISSDIKVKIAYICMLMMWPIINFLLLMTWTDINNANQVQGVQGRYFYPVMIFLALMVGKHYKKWLYKWGNYILGSYLIFIIIVNIDLIIKTIDRYY